MQSFEYAIKLRADPDGGFVVTCRDLPQLVTQGADREDALAQAVDAMDEVFAAYMLADLEFPLASDSRRGEYSVAPPAETVAKAALYTSMRKARVSKSQLARLLGIDEKEVRRLLDPHYGSKLPRIAQAVAALGDRLVIGVRPAF